MVHDTEFRVLDVTSPLEKGGAASKRFYATRSMVYLNGPQWGVLLVS